MSNFRLGAQPQWAGEEPANPFITDTFISTELLKQDIVSQLYSRGYAVVPISHELQSMYQSLVQELTFFFNSDISKKSIYAVQQFDKEKHSPNQLHGFSVVDGLKEQLMLRVGDGDIELPLPESLRKIVDPCFFAFDQICRSVVPQPAVLSCLDPDPLPPGYPSSAILDCFYYYGKETGGDRFHNNHAAHTDSGTLTLVVCSDEPGLEVYDQKEKCWIALEKLIHSYCSKNPSKTNRDYATLFWGDSVATMETQCKLSLGSPCLHRVASCGGKSRVSVVYKQRSAPLKTFCRYQEDYLLAAVQLKATDNIKPSEKKSTEPWIPFGVLATAAMVVVGSAIVARKVLAAY